MADRLTHSTTRATRATGVSTGSLTVGTPLVAASAGRWLVVGACLLLNACGDPNSDPGRAPTSARGAKRWVEQDVRYAMSHHGKWDHDDWSAIRSTPKVNDQGRLTLRIEKVELKGVTIKATPMQLNTVSDLNGIEWAFQVTHTAEASRVTDLESGQVGDWTEGYNDDLVFSYDFWAGEPRWALIYKKEGESPTYASTRFEFETKDWDDYWDSYLRQYHPPSLSIDSARLRESAAISDVIGQDMEVYRVSQEDKVSCVPGMTLIDLSGCPPSFAQAYRDHIDAWKRGNQSDVKSTWMNLTDKANSWGVGTLKPGLLLRLPPGYIRRSSNSTGEAQAPPPAA